MTLHPKSCMRALPCLIAGLWIGGCTPHDMTDLVAYADAVKARPAARVTPLPDLDLAPQRVVYHGGGRDPFQPPAQPVRDVVKPPIPPIPRAPGNREALEAYELDSLRMVGTVDHGSGTFGLVRAPDGVVHRVRAGNYVGRHNGRVLAVAEHRIELTELVLEGREWHERDAALEMLD